MIKDVDMDQDEKSAALRNQGLVRQARYADRDGTTAKAKIKHMRKAGSSDSQCTLPCHHRTLQFAICCHDHPESAQWRSQSWPSCCKQTTTATAMAHAPTCEPPTTAQVLTSFKVQKRCSADHIRCLSSALTVGHGHGLETYIPNTRLIPGGPLVLDPPDIQDRPFIKEVIDEAATGVAGAIFMFSKCGVRGYYDTDNCHRLNNDFHNAIRRAALWIVYCKLVMLTTVNKGPWLGGDFLERKAETLVAMLSCICCDPLNMANHAEGMAFDQGLTLPPVHDPDDIHALAKITADRWLDMASFTKRSGAAGSSDSQTITQAHNMFSTILTS